MVGKVLLMTQDDRKKTIVVPVLVVQPNAGADLQPAIDEPHTGNAMGAPAPTVPGYTPPGATARPESSETTTDQPPADDDGSGSGAASESSEKPPH